MKKIIIVSDSHGNDKALKDIILAHPNADAYLHLGDSETFEENIYPFITIKGNNDYYIVNEYRILHIGPLNIYMTHGHKMYLDKENIVSKARKNNCNMFLFGHTHKPFYELYKGIYIINPGSLAYPRSTMGETFAIVTIKDDNSIDVEFQKYN